MNLDEKTKTMIRQKAKHIMTTAKYMAEDNDANFWQCLTVIQLEVGEIVEHLSGGRE